MNSSDICDYIVAYFDDKGDLVTNKKVQKLLYYVEAWHLVHLKNPLIDEDFQAWMFGPVLPSLYDRLKTFGNKPILIDYSGVEPADKMKAIADVHQLKQTQQELIDEVLTKYGPLSSAELEMMSHEERPWKEARKNLPPGAACTNIISKKTMANFYQRMLDEFEKQA